MAVQFVDSTDELFARSRMQCELVKTAARAHELLDSVNEAALDFETTALDPDVGEIRITTICNDQCHFVLDHYFVGPFEDYVHHFTRAGTYWWVFNAKFEVKWIDYHDPSESCKVGDIDFLKKAKLGGMPNKLAWMAKDIGVLMDKEEQSSDWSRPALTQSQYDYAGFDGFVTWRLKKHWLEQLDDNQKRGFNVFNDAVRATIECEDTGLFLDSSYHKHVVGVWKTRQATFERYLRRWTPPSLIKNLASDMQVAKFLENELADELLEHWPRTAKKKQMQLESKYLRNVARQLPYPMSRWMAALVGFKYYNKYLSTYGDTLLTKQELHGKITSRFNIAQAITGRYSSSNSNLQNIPRKPLVRRAFHAVPGSGKLMVLADYSGIEIRVLAELSGDKQLLEDTIYGDVHAASASQIFNLDLDYLLDVLESKGEGKYANVYPDFKEKRSKAKAFTFQLTYGAGPGALSYALRCTYDEAIHATDKWAQRYPLAYNFRYEMFNKMMDTGYLPVVDGRTIYVWRQDLSVPVASNYPIQGAAASVMYRALYHVRNRFQDNALDAYLAASVHDEILSYAHKSHADEAMAQQLGGMRDGWLDIFPNTNTDNLMDYKIGTSWADKP